MIQLQTWADDILQTMKPVCEILDADNKDKPYSAALKLQQQLVDNADLTPSAKILQTMREREHPFGRFGLDASAEHEEYFKSQPPLDDAIVQRFNEMAIESHKKQQQIEADDSLSFDEFLKNYFAQH